MLKLGTRNSATIFYLHKQKLTSCSKQGQENKVLHDCVLHLLNQHTTGTDAVGLYTSKLSALMALYLTHSQGFFHVLCTMIKHYPTWEAQQHGQREGHFFPPRVIIFKLTSADTEDTNVCQIIFIINKTVNCNETITVKSDISRWLIIKGIWHYDKLQPFAFKRLIIIIHTQIFYLTCE